MGKLTRNSLVNLAQSIVGERDMAEDVVQEVSSRNPMLDGSHLIQAVTFRARDLLKTKNTHSRLRHEHATDIERNCSGSNSDIELHAHLSGFYDKLSPIEKRVFTALAEGYGTYEIIGLLGLSQWRTNLLVQRIRSKLRSSLNGEEG